MGSNAEHPLVQFRDAAGVTQETLAAASGVARSTIAAIEARTTSPSRRTVRRLALVLGLSPDTLAGALSGSVGAEAVVPLVQWQPESPGPGRELPALHNDSTIQSAASVSRAIMAASRRNRATLDELDIVRKCINSLGPIDPIADVLREHEPETVQKVFDLLFDEARTNPSHTGVTILLTVLLNVLDRLAWSTDPLDPPYTFTVRKLR